MGLIAPDLPEYDIAAWRGLPFPERMRLVCRAWAAQGYGTPLAIYLLYALKIAAYVGVWLWACTRKPGWDLANIGEWWASFDALGKAAIWTALFEGLGLGCGSGPLTGRYLPPLGGFLYFLRPGTTKLPLLPGMGHRRTLLDVALYAAVAALLVRALLAPSLSAGHLVPVLAGAALLGLLDKTLFLALRSEHHLSILLVLALAGREGTDWIAGSKVVWVAIWWWAATSKVNAHFPAVMCVMTSNAPWTRWGPLRRWVYRNPPDDLRPSRFAAAFAHTGTLLEYTFPLLLLLDAGGPLTVPVLVVATLFHLFIMSNVPMGVPLEWNVIMIYGAWALFGAHAGVPISSLAAPAVAGWLVGFHLLLPLYGSVYPERVSFLLAMRYYAGNWAYSVWLWGPGALAKLDARLTKPARLVDDQLRAMYDEDTVTALMSKVVAFRAMHLHGRALHRLLPIAVDDLDAREWLDGEIVAGLALGWNFGEGHLHDEQLLEALQAQCDFAPGEVRCVFVESQPLFGRTLAWRVADAATGRLASGEIEVASLIDEHPWPAPSGT